MTLYCSNELIRLAALTIRQPDNTGQSLLLTVTTATLMVHAVEPPQCAGATDANIHTHTGHYTRHVQNCFISGLPPQWKWDTRCFGIVRSVPTFRDNLAAPSSRVYTEFSFSLWTWQRRFNVKLTHIDQSFAFPGRGLPLADGRIFIGQMGRKFYYGARKRKQCYVLRCWANPNITYCNNLGTWAELCT